MTPSGIAYFTSIVTLSIFPVGFRSSFNVRKAPSFDNRQLRGQINIGAQPTELAGLGAK
jgi:hypothetical protein